MGFEWASAEPPWDREKSGMAVCGRERVCYPSTRDPLEKVCRDRVRRDGLRTVSGTCEKIELGPLINRVTY